jgi:hypothetical protein
MSTADKGTFAWIPGRSTGPSAHPPGAPAAADAGRSGELDAWAPTRQHPPLHTAPQPPAHPPSVLEAWQPTRALPSSSKAPGAVAEAWQATRAHTSLATRIMADEDEYLSGETADIGRQTTAGERELFVSCAPAEALQQQFEHLRPDFIALHDVATATSRKLLVGIGAASGRAVQKLIIRRQGQGTPLATLEFVDLPTADQRPLRLYTTEVDAGDADRQGLAHVLLAYSRLGAVTIGDLDAAALEQALQPLHDAILAGPWPGRDLLLLPLSAAATLAHQAARLGRGTGVTVRCTPRVGRPADAWAFITGTWNRLREQASAGAASLPQLSGFLPAIGAAVAGARRAGETTSRTDAEPPATGTTGPAPLAMREIPVAPGAEPASTGNLLERYVRQVGELAGVIGCCVFEIQSGRPRAYAGTGPGANDLGGRGRELLNAMSASSSALGLGLAVPEAAITLAAHHLLLRALPRHPELALHAVLDKSRANLTLARLQVARMDPLFDAPGAA